MSYRFSRFVRLRSENVQSKAKFSRWRQRVIEDAVGNNKIITIDWPRWTTREESDLSAGEYLDSMSENTPISDQEKCVTNKSIIWRNAC